MLWVDSSHSPSPSGRGWGGGAPGNPLLCLGHAPTPQSPPLKGRGSACPLLAATRRYRKVAAAAIAPAPVPMTTALTETTMLFRKKLA